MSGIPEGARIPATSIEARRGRYTTEEVIYLVEILEARIEQLAAARIPSKPPSPFYRLWRALRNSQRHSS